MDKARLMAELVLAGKNVSWLADELGISTQAMYKKISGQSSTTIEDAKAISTALDLPPDKIKAIFFG